MIALCLALCVQATPVPPEMPQEVRYADLSEKLALRDADSLMRDGQYLEAAVAYRNALLQPGDREAIRVPFALALFAHGDTSYAGIELRRAHTLYPDFARLIIDPTDLFGMRTTLGKLAEEAARQKPEGDGADAQAILAYALCLAGELEPASDAVDRYAQARGEDALVKTLRQLIDRRAGKPAPAPVATAPLPPPAVVAQARVGEPARAGTRYANYLVRPKGEILER